MDRQNLSRWLHGLSGAHALKFDQESDRAAFFAALIRSPAARQWWAIPAEGGLLGDYGVLENIFLPAQAMDEATAMARFTRWCERLESAGIPRLPLLQPLALLSPWQRRLAAFLRAVVADAPALIFDDTCYGLSRTEHRYAVRMHEFYRQYFSLRPTVYVTLSAPPAELEIPTENFHHHEHAFAAC
jgi:hypothetical protein